MVRLPGLPLQARRGCWSDGAPSRPTLTGRPQHSALVSALKCVLVSISEPPYNVLRSALNVLTPQVSAPLGTLFPTCLALNLLSGVSTSGRECGAAQAGRGGSRTHCRHDTRCASAAMMCGAPVCVERKYMRRKQRCGTLVCLGPGGCGPHTTVLQAVLHCGAGSTSLHLPISRTGKLATVLRDELLPPTVLQVGGERTMWDGTMFGGGGWESRHVGWYRGAAMLHGYCSYPLFRTGDALGHGSLSRCYPFVPPTPPPPLPPSSSLPTGSP